MKEIKLSTRMTPLVYTKFMTQLKNTSVLILKATPAENKVDPELVIGTVHRCLNLNSKTVLHVTLNDKYSVGAGYTLSELSDGYSIILNS